MLPLGFGAFGLLLPGVSQGSLVLSILGGITVALGVATFFARSERFVDTRRRAVVSVKRWLWLHSETVLPLAHYDHVRVIANSDTNAQHDHTVLWAGLVLSAAVPLRPVVTGPEAGFGGR